MLVTRDGGFQRQTSSREASRLLSHASVFFFFFFLGRGEGSGLREDILLRSILIATERERDLSLMQPNPGAFKSC